MNETLNTEDNRKNLRKEKAQFALAQGAFTDKKNMIFAVIGSVLFGFVFSFALTAGYHLLNLFLALFAGLVILDILIIKSKEYDTKNLFFWNIIIMVFTSVFFRTTIDYYVVMASLAYPTLFVSLILFSTKYRHVNGKRFIGQHFAFFAHLGHIFKAVYLVSDKKRKKSDSWKTISNVLIGIVIAVLALLIILPIMSNADMFFENFMNNLFERSIDIEISEFTWKLILGVFFTMCGFGFIYTGLAKQYDTAKNEKQFKISQIMIITILSIIGIAYIAFISTQVKHLFLTKPTGVLEGASFAEYARNGFFEMVWLSTINIIIILGCILFSNNKKQYHRILKTLMVYFNAVNLYLLIVSFYKMYLYQSEFGFTQKRILVYIYIVYQLIILILLALKIFKHDFKFWITALYFSCIFWGTISFLNIQDLSFELNVKRYEQTGEIDTEYLNSYTNKGANSAIKDFYFEYKNELSHEQLKDIARYFSATYVNELEDFIYDKQKIQDLIQERFKTHELLEVNIQNQLFAKNSELVLIDYYNEFIAK